MSNMSLSVHTLRGLALSGVVALTAALAPVAAHAQISPPSPSEPTSPPSYAPGSPNQPGAHPPVYDRDSAPTRRDSPPAAHRPMQGAPRTDPKQWHTEDRTRAQHYATARKEAGAGYQESLNECRRAPKPERAACNKEARQAYNDDLAHVKREYGGK